MEMEDQNHHPQQYAITDLRQLMNNNTPRSPHFPSMIPPHPTADLFPIGHPNSSHHPHYDMMMFGRQVADIMPRCLHEFASADHATTADGTVNTSIAATPTTTTTTTSASTPPLSGLGGAEAGIGGDASTGRWPRQETLTLLEIRSRLDLKFKEANQKVPLWDEVSRIMCEEHGYQRSGKKCREKFENLYKYYKKTKEGKAGRQDGKHYRFFRQLEALYGDSCNNTSSAPPETTNFGGGSTTTLRHRNQETAMLQSHSLSLTNSTDFQTSSSDDGHDSMDKMNNRRKSGRNNWKGKIKDFIDSQMRKLVEKQEEWLEKLMNTMEQKEKERVLREEEWRRQEAARMEREHKFWAKERAWIESRDAALMEALQKLSGNSENRNGDGGSEIQNIVAKKRKEENSRSCYYFESNGQPSSLYNNTNQGSGGYCDINDQRQQQGNDHGSSPSNSNVGSAGVHAGDTSCFPFLMSSEGGNLWDNYSLKVNKANQNQ